MTLKQGSPKSPEDASLLPYILRQSSYVTVYINLPLYCSYYLGIRCKQRNKGVEKEVFCKCPLDGNTSLISYRVEHDNKGTT